MNRYFFALVIIVVLVSLMVSRADGQRYGPEVSGLTAPPVSPTEQSEAAFDSIEDQTGDAAGDADIMRIWFESRPPYLDVYYRIAGLEEIPQGYGSYTTYFLNNYYTLWFSTDGSKWDYAIVFNPSWNDRSPFCNLYRVENDYVYFDLPVKKLRLRADLSLASIQGLTPQDLGSPDSFAVMGAVYGGPPTSVYSKDWVPSIRDLAPNQGAVKITLSVESQEAEITTKTAITVSPQTSTIQGPEPLTATTAQASEARTDYTWILAALAIIVAGAALYALKKKH